MRGTLRGMFWSKCGKTLAKRSEVMIFEKIRSGKRRLCSYQNNSISRFQRGFSFPSDFSSPGTRSRLRTSTDPESMNLGKVVSLLFSASTKLSSDSSGGLNRSEYIHDPGSLAWIPRTALDYHAARLLIGVVHIALLGGSLQPGCELKRELLIGVKS